MAIKAVVFDFDGVIADSFEMCCAVFLEKNPDKAREDFKRNLRGNYWKSAAKHEKSDSYIREFEKAYRERIAKIQMQPEIQKAILQLASKYPLFIISSSGESNMRFFLERNGLGNSFAAILGRDSHFSKVEKFRRIFRENGFQPDECIFVTDTLGDILEGKEVGVKTIGVTWGFHDVSTLLEGEPDFIIKNREDLVNAVSYLG